MKLIGNDDPGLQAINRCLAEHEAKVDILPGAHRLQRLQAHPHFGGRSRAGIIVFSSAIGGRR